MSPYHFHPPTQRFWTFVKGHWLVNVKVKNESFSRLVMSDSATPWIVACQAPLSVEFSGQDTGVDCHFLLPPQGLNPGLLLCRWILYCLSFFAIFFFSVPVSTPSEFCLLISSHLVILGILYIPWRPFTVPVSPTFITLSSIITWTSLLLFAQDFQCI